LFSLLNKSRKYTIKIIPQFPLIPSDIFKLLISSKIKKGVKNNEKSFIENALSNVSKYKFLINKIFEYLNINISVINIPINLK
jgi:hypothetical protein